MKHLYSFQCDGVKWLKTQPNCFLADEPGLGKTITSLTAAWELGCRKVLVICPAIAVAHWHEHFKEWAPGILVRTVVTYNKLAIDADLQDNLKSKEWDLLILDEGHYLKNKSAKRTKAIYGVGSRLKNSLAGKAKRVWILSGTPSPNHAGELWTHLRALWPELILNLSNKPMNEYEFQNRFCKVVDTVYGRQIKGSKNIPALRTQIAPMILRRKKVDVLPDLPPLVFRIEPVDPPTWMKDTDVDMTIPDISGDDLLAYIKANATNLAAERRHTSMIKAQIACEWIDNELSDSYHKLIVFGWHTDALRTIMIKMAQYKPVLLDGSTPPNRKPELIEQFQTDPDTRLFVGQIAACGVAITLTAASNILFVEQDWVPDNNYQAACRAHRIGQKDGVLARVLSLRNSVDDKIQRVLVRKQNDLAALFD